MTSSQGEQSRTAAELLTGTARRLFGIGRADLARTLAGLALEADPRNGDAHAVMAGVLDSDGQFSPALRHWREAARLQPAQPRQQLNLALALLGGGDWESGLPLYEARLESGDWSTMAARPSLDMLKARHAGPETSLAGRHVLVVTEQGLGDSIWAARFLAPLARRCGRVTVATSAVLRPVLAAVSGPADVINPPAGQPGARINLHAPEAACDHIIPMMSLPWVLGVRPDPAADGRVPYFRPDPEKVAAWRERYRQALPNTRRIAGLIWRGNPNGPASQLRSMTVDALAPFAAVEGVGFVILQADPKPVRMQAMRVLLEAQDGLAFGAEPTPLDEYAAAIAATDLLVSVDTMGAHLAGAMGHPGLVMLAAAPSLGCIFWGHSGERSVWYPSLRLIRQDRYRDWAGAIQAAVAALRGDC